MAFDGICPTVLKVGFRSCHKFFMGWIFARLEVCFREEILDVAFASQDF